MLALVCMTGTVGAFISAVPLIVPVAMVTSLFVALIATPFLAFRWLKVKPVDLGAGTDGLEHGASPWLVRFFTRLLTPFLRSAARRNVMFISLIIALGICFTFPSLQIVKINMMPKQDKNTFLVSIDMPAGTSLNATDRLVQDIEERLLHVDEVEALVTTVGTASIIDFAGLLRGGGGRNDAAMADIRVKLVEKHKREITSIDLVKLLRPGMSELSEKHNGIVKLLEDPPGPAVRSPILAEIYGPYGEQQREQVWKVHELFAATSNVVDVDDTTRATAKQLQLVINPEKARLAGLTTKDITSILYASFAGYRITALHNPADSMQTPVVLRFPAAYRNEPTDIDNFMLPTAAGLTPLSALCSAVTTECQPPVYHKDLRPVSYVYGDVESGPSSQAVSSMMKALQAAPLAPGFKLEWKGEHDQISTVMRDIGLSMTVAIILIYLMLLGRFRSFADPVVILSVVPLTMLGVLPGYAIIGQFGLYLGAVSMVGIIALGGIVVRNSIILIEFIKDAVAAGSSLEQAVILAGAIRTRPILLTAVAAVAGMLVVIRDALWSGMTWTLLFGVFASTSLSLVVVPVLYYAVTKYKEGRARSD
jgi:multidrug efflux pump subunit AcrB